MRSHLLRSLPRCYIPSWLVGSSRHQWHPVHECLLAEADGYVYLYLHFINPWMFRKRYRQQIPELNTTSTADISFMLLIFFLVTSSMDTDKGLMRQMTPPPAEHEQPMDINKDLVMNVEIDANNQLMLNGKAVTPVQLTEEVRTMASVNPTGHVVAVQADREATYETYFRMQDAVVSAYNSLRQQYAQEHYGKSYQRCTAEERSVINDRYPQRISEAPIEKGGRP